MSLVRNAPVSSFRLVLSI